MAINVGDLVLVAFFTGIGAGIGSPIGNWIFEKLVKRSMNRIDIEALISELKKKDYEGLGLLREHIKKKE